MGKNKVKAKKSKGEVEQYGVFVTDPDEFLGGTPAIWNPVYYGNKDPLPASMGGGIDTLKKMVE